MGRLVLLSENFFNSRLFSDHVVSANAETSGHEAWYVGSARRQRDLNHWTPTTTNAQAWLQVACDRPRAADMIAIDRGHNLGGETVRVQASSNGSSWTTAAVVTLPSQVYPYARLNQAPGVRTEEGAWLYRFTLHSGKYWRVVFDAMGAGLKPEVVGLYLGLSFRPAFPVVKPFTHGKRELDYEITKSPYAWAGAGTISQRRRAPIHLKLQDRDEYAQARYHIEELALRARPTWVVMDDDEAEKAFLARAEPQTAGFEISGDWSEFQGEFEMPEHEPAVV